MSLLCFMVMSGRVYKQLVGYSFRCLTQNHTWKNTKIRSSIWKQIIIILHLWNPAQCLLLYLLIPQASQAMQTALFLASSKNGHNIRETFIVESCLQGRHTSSGPMFLSLPSHKPACHWHKQHFSPGQVFQTLEFSCLLFNISIWIEAAGSEQVPGPIKLHHLEVHWHHCYLKKRSTHSTCAKYNFHHYKYFHIQKMWIYIWFVLYERNYYTKFPFWLSMCCLICNFSED